MLSRPVPSEGGGRALVLTGAFILRLYDASGEALALCDLVAGGGPGGGGGRGIPGSQPRAGGDRVGDWLAALDELALFTIGPAETALLAAGGRVDV